MEGGITVPPERELKSMFTAAFDDVVLTVRPVDPVTPPEAALIVADPAPAALTTPCEPAVLLTVATDVLPELQVAEVVMFALVPLL